MNTGAYDPLAEIVALAHEHGAWVHVDGAFGLWAAAGPPLRRLMDGDREADSWATDGHKWLNVPYDSRARLRPRRRGPPRRARGRRLLSSRPPVHERDG